mmetsp:Transcript_17721/g.41092  ORF Transcript_17721/g.41092 Transcript_17721/m.41092 type:complete len:173 (+) Transcript_17721:73-591(+)
MFCCCTQSPNDHKFVEIANEPPLELKSVSPVQNMPPKDGEVVEKEAPAVALEAGPPEPDAPPEVEGDVEGKPVDVPDAYTAKLVKGSGKKLGMVIGHSATHNVVKVQTVKDSSVAADWNSDNPAQKVEEGCFILEINGQQTSSMTVQQIGEMLEKSTEVLLLLSKKPPLKKR